MKLGELDELFLAGKRILIPMRDPLDAALAADVFSERHSQCSRSHSGRRVTRGVGIVHFAIGPDELRGMSFDFAYNIDQCTPDMLVHVRKVQNRLFASSVRLVDAISMHEAPKDTTAILAQFRPDLSTLYPHWRAAESLEGAFAVIRHPGLAEDGFDVGWSLAGPFGQGVGDDEAFVGWWPLPNPEPNDAQKRGRT